MKDDLQRKMTDSDKRAAATAAGVGKILAFEAENFKKIRVVSINPKGHLVELTGKNGNGKTSVLDALWFLLKGKAALPPSAVRNGAERLRVKGDFGAFVVTRTMGRDSALPSMTLEMARGKTAWDTPQAMLDGIMGELAFDPLEFVRMAPKVQVETLRKAVKLDLDIEALNEANQVDYNDRTVINKVVKELQAQVNAAEVLEGLPKEKINEQKILDAIDQAGEANRKAQEAFRIKHGLGQKVTEAQANSNQNEEFLKTLGEKIEELQRQLELAKQAKTAAELQRERLAESVKQAQQAFDAAQDGEPVDVAALSAELQSAQRTNRAIDKRSDWEKLQARLKEQETKVRTLTQQMEARDEKKRRALADAHIPVDGLTFDETRVLYRGLPLENLGEGEAIKVSTRLGMALNPTLRVMRIPHGEALDDDGLKILAELAEEFDYQIWMARVDSSGKIGLVLEDGMIVARNEASE
jgi:energy-coupling factor transporter ATP-binding protein EcfA2